MVFVSGFSLYCSMLSVLTVAAVQRVKTWDVKRARVTTREEARERDKNPLVPAALRVASRGRQLHSEPLCILVLTGMVDDIRCPLGWAMLAFPANCVLLVAAVTIRVLQPAEPWLQMTAPVVLGLIGLPTLFYSHRLV
eukprot:489460-Prymnesium_polylepis.2